MKPLKLYDQDLQRRLDKISDGDFSRRFTDETRVDNDSFTDKDGNEWERVPYYIVDFGPEVDEDGVSQKRCFRAVIFDYQIDPDWEPEYDPEFWNSFPDVRPPSGDIMRLQFWDEKEEHRVFMAAYFDTYLWFDMDDKEIDLTHATKIRFRPWFDEDEEEIE